MSESNTNGSAVVQPSASEKYAESPKKKEKKKTSKKKRKYEKDKKAGLSGITDMDLSNDDPRLPPYRQFIYKPPIVVPRADWGARPPREEVPLEHPTPHILYVDTGTEECETEEQCVAAVRALQQRDMDERGLPDIQYNFLVGGDFRVYEGRGWHSRATKEPRHEHLEGKSLDIAYIGNFRDKNPWMEQWNAGGFLLSHGLSHRFVSMDFQVTDLWESQSFDVDELIRKGELHKIDFHWKLPPDPI